MPQGRKYVPSHSGGMEAKPLRANWRISSRWSQGFLARFRRSTRWALVSVGADIFSVASLAIHGLIPSELALKNLRPEGLSYRNCAEKRKAHVPVIWHVGLETETSKRA